MPLTRTTLIRLLKILAAIIGVAIIIGYAAWRSFNYVQGPHIDIFEPVNGSSILKTTVIIRGQAVRINNMTLNGQPIAIDESGNFAEAVIIFPGINRLTLAGQDQFGRNSSSELILLGTLPFPSTKPVIPATIATSSTASTSTRTSGTSTQQ